MIVFANDYEFGRRKQHIVSTSIDKAVSLAAL